MERERWLKLMRDNETRLTRDEINEGWHFCQGWDELLIDPLSPEWGTTFARCCCGHEVPDED
jgi:hypothetical protein